jgi:hypothetical protein
MFAYFPRTHFSASGGTEDPLGSQINTLWNGGYSMSCTAGHIDQSEYFPDASLVLPLSWRMVVAGRKLGVQIPGRLCVVVPNIRTDPSEDNLAWFIPVSLAYYPVFFLSLLGILWGKGAWKK